MLAWRLIDEDTPKDRPIIVFAPGNFHGDPDLVCLCQWHPDAGFTVCELRTATHWMDFYDPRDDEIIQGNIKNIWEDYINKSKE